MVIDRAGGDGVVRLGGNVRPITGSTNKPASTYNASTILSESTVKPPSSSAPTTTKPPMQTTPSVEAPPKVTATIPPINIPPPSSQPQLPPEIVEVNGHLVRGYLPGLEGMLVSAPKMTPHGIVGGIEGGNPPNQPRGILVSEPILPLGALEKLHESSPSGTTETVQIGNLTFSGVRVVNLSTPPTTPKETTPPTSGGSSSTTHKTGTLPSTPVSGPHTSPQPPGGGTTTSKSTPPHEMPTPIPIPIRDSENLPVRIVSEPILPPGKEFTPPSGSSSGASHEVGTPPSTPITGSHTGSLGTGGTTSPKSAPPHERLSSPEHNAIPITPIEGTSVPPHVTPPSEVKEAPTNVITHLWIGWRIEPEVEEFIRRFVETFEHGRHPRMGGAPPPGALPSPPGVLPLPGAPLVVLLPQGTEQKQRVTV